MTFDPNQIQALQAPLDKSRVAERSQAGRQLSYVEAWWVIAEANRIFGHDMWDRETLVLSETNSGLFTIKKSNGEEYEQFRVGYFAKVRVTVYTATGSKMVREGTGFGSGMSKPEAAGEAHESAIKEAESDAMKRALMTFGNPFGLALYDKTQANVKDHDAGRKSAAQAKRDGDHDTIKDQLAKCPDIETLGAWQAIELPKWLALCPRSWEEPITDLYLKRRDEIIDAANEEGRPVV